MNTRIVFSPSRRRPGCVLLQAAMGGDVDPEAFHRLFPAETWLISLTDDMAAYPIDEKHTLEVLSRIAGEALDKLPGREDPREKKMTNDDIDKKVLAATDEEALAYVLALKP